MGGGLDLALACHHRIASPHAVLGHRGAALGLITGWGGTQRLPQLIGKARALEMFVAAEKITAVQALRIGLADAIAADPVAEAVRRIRHRGQWNDSFDKISERGPHCAALPAWYTVISPRLHFLTVSRPMADRNESPTRELV